MSVIAYYTVNSPLSRSLLGLGCALAGFLMGLIVRSRS